MLTVFAKEFRENLRERRTLITALIVGPLLCPGLFAGALSLQTRRSATEGDRPIELAVAHGARAPNLLAFLRQYGVALVPVAYDDAAARAAVQAHRHELVLAVNDDFGARLAAGDPAPLALYSDSSQLSAVQDFGRVQSLIRQYGALLARLRMAARGVDPLLLAPLAVQDIDVSTPASRSVLVLGTLSYLILVTMLMGGMYLAIDATAGERERGSLEPLLALPVRREWLIFGKILATCAYMTLSLTLTVMAFATVLHFSGLERFGMSVNFGPGVALAAILYCLPLVPLGAALMTIVAAFTRTYREAQTWLGLVLVVPTLPVVFAAALGLRPSAALMGVPSLSQHFLITSLLRAEVLPPGWIALSVSATLILGALLIGIAGRLYHREALLG
ncbi:MAG: ABC transporter permease [Steroidobacteraceae bacterium]